MMILKKMGNPQVANSMNFDNTYARLPQDFYQKVLPSSAKEAILVKLNDELVKLLNITEADADYFAGKKLFKGSDPIAMAYSGHQFGHFNPTLGDGRAILLGEVIGTDNIRYDLHLKGSGLTPFSRRGDGLSGLGPVVREYIVSEAMHALGIPTTRALSITLTGVEVIRQDAQPGASMIRVARGHIRVGTFEYFLYQDKLEHLQTLVDYCLDRFYPELKDDPDKNFKFFQTVARKKLSLVAKWMGVGFIHGVMNTDNTTVSGETIDFGPCAFMDTFVSEKVYSSIDRYGRYAFSNQGHIALWNMSKLGNCLIPLAQNPEAEVEKYNHELQVLQDYFEQEKLQVFAKKLGIKNPEADDQKLITKFLNDLEERRLDFTNSFRNLPENLNDFPYLKERSEDVALMNSVNPYIIPRNHQVEAAIQMACKGDYTHLNQLNSALSDPYTENKSIETLTYPPKPSEIVHQTFCGT